MNKTQTWTAVLEIIETLDTTKKNKTAFTEAMAELLAPKKSAGSLHPPRLDEDNNIIEAYCRYHKEYEPVEDMVMADGKSKGYCKAAASVSNKRRKQVRDLNLESLDIMDTDIDKATALRAQAKEIEPTINDAETYDLVSDWAEFNATTAK